MKSCSALLSMFATLIALASCASVPSEPAAWDASPGAMRHVFPDSEFIAEQGRGATRAAAEANASASLAQFFSSEIASRIAIREQYQEQNGAAQASTEIESETFVQSQVTLFGIRHAQDAYFDKRSREWVTVAYIDRAEAWKVFALRFTQQSQAFARLFDVAETESDFFRKALRYTAAQDFARLPDFRSAESLGQLLDPAKMAAEFATTLASLSALPQKAADARRNAPVFIDISSDFESLLQNAFAQKFASLGFPVAKNSDSAAAVCLVTVEEGRQDRQLGIFYFPKVQTTLTSPAGTLFTFSTEADQQSAVTADVAKRRAYQALAEAVQTNFSLATNF